MNDKELQNDMRIMATSEKGVSPKNTTEEALQASYIVSGKIQADSELNNIHHLAGLLPPTVGQDTHTVNQIETLSRIDLDQLKFMRTSMTKQLFSLNTLDHLRIMLDTLEFQ